MIPGGTDNGAWYTDAQILDIRQAAYREARKFSDNIARQLAEEVAERRRVEDELERVQKQLRTAELFIPLAERIGYTHALEIEQGPPSWEGSE